MGIRALLSQQPHYQPLQPHATNHLKLREAMIKEVEPLIPSVKELQSKGITFDLLMPFLIAVNEVAAENKVDLKTGADELIHELKDLRYLNGMQQAIKAAENQLDQVGSFLRSNQEAFDTLRKLKRVRFSDKQIQKLVVLVNAWGSDGYKKLDTDLIDVGNQLPNNGNNGYEGNLSETDQIKLNLLRNATSNMINKIGIKNYVKT